MPKTHRRMAIAASLTLALTSLSPLVAYAEGASSTELNKLEQSTQEHHAMGADKSPPTAAADQRVYAGISKRKIKALSKERIEGLSKGNGLSYALAAELNSYPGPRHALAIAKELGLSDAQHAKIQVQFNDMEAKAIVLGNATIEKEEALDSAFSSENIDSEILAGLVTEIAQIEGQLRTVHLSTHLVVRKILSPDQVKLYDQLRGYAE